MAYDRFMIAPSNTGLETDITPWLLPEDAFTKLNNAYIYQGRVVKRCGSMFMVPDPLKSRLAVLLGTTDGAGNLAGNVPGASFKIGQLFSIGDTIYTVYQTGNPVAMLKTDGTTTATFSTTTGAYNFAGAPINTDVYWYPAEPVMGIETFEFGPINDQPTYAWDTQFVYKFIAGNRWLRQTTGTPLWHGDYNDFFWATTWQSTASTAIMFVTNFNVTASGAPAAGDDPIWKLDSSTNTWATFKPQFLTAGNVVQGCRIIIHFKGRLLLMNIVESNAAVTANTSYPSRCRFSWVGDPTNANGWLEPNQANAGGGGFTDAPTEEAIISAEFIKDRLIVYFEQSTWELVYTNNFVEPFLWQKINTELGSNTTFSTVPFDKSVLAIGSTGVNACNGANVERIDQKIPLEVLKFNQVTNASYHLHGIRDYEKELVYWTYVTNLRAAEPYFANNLLVYNYRNNSWAFFRDSFTCFGYFEQAESLTWEALPIPWASADFTWDAYEDASHTRRVLGGTTEGWVVNIMPDRAQNETYYQITNIPAPVSNQTRLVIVNHTMNVDEYIYITNCSGVTGLNGNIYQITRIVDDNTIEIGYAPYTGTYTGGGRVSFVSQIDFSTKMLNPYVKDGRNVFIPQITCCVQKTGSGAITVEAYPSSSSLMVNSQDAVPGVVLSNGVLETSPYTTVPFEQYQTRLWHPIYLQTEGEFVQINFYLSPSQMTNTATAFADFELEGMVIYAMPTADRLQ